MQTPLWLVAWLWVDGDGTWPLVFEWLFNWLWLQCWLLIFCLFVPQQLDAIHSYPFQLFFLPLVLFFVNHSLWYKQIIFPQPEKQFWKAKIFPLFPCREERKMNALRCENVFVKIKYLYFVFLLLSNLLLHNHCRAHCSALTVIVYVLSYGCAIGIAVDVVVVVVVVRTAYGLQMYWCNLNCIDSRLLFAYNM